MALASNRNKRRIGRVLTAAVLLIALVAFIPTGSSARTSLYFQHASTFDVIEGNGSGVAEIVDASRDGKQLAYTDGDNDAIGFVDISNPLRPKGQGTVDVGGEPTSLVIRNNLVLVGVNTSESFTEPSGQLVVVNRRNHRIVATFELGGQPDSVALSPNRTKAAIVIENERDEDLGGGLLPQLPSGTLLIVDLKGPARNWTISEADLSPVAAGAANGSDLEAEYVDINDDNLAVVTFQENNHLAVVDLDTGETVSEFSAGSAQLSNVDTEEEDLINLDSDITKRREPDAVTWIDDDSFATANEGDYEDENGEEGGSRGFTIFNIDGTVEYESAESFEHQLVSVGHYNEGRSENKGVEPEAVEYGRFRGRDYLCVGSERSNAVGVYQLTDDGPQYQQVLPTGMGPEGLKAIERRGLFIVSTEADQADDGIPTMINIFRIRTRSAPTYPMIESADDANGLPIPWVALSGLAADPVEAKTLYAVNDSFLAAGFVYEIDVTGKPATIVDRTEVVGASADLDLEGVAVGPDGSWWLASEGNSSDRPNLILHVDPATGAVMSEIELPADLVDQRRGNGLEGLAVTGEAGAEVVYVAIQRAWPDEGDTDEVNTKIGRYDVASGTWGFVHYNLEPEGGGDWVGLSAMEPLPNGQFAVIERDKGWGPSTGFNAELKSIYVVDLAAAEFRAFDDPAGLATVDKTLAYDLMRRLSKASIWTTEKVEGLAVAADGQVYVVTDNDGVDDAPGETVFLRLGKLKARFR